MTLSGHVAIMSLDEVVEFLATNGLEGTLDVTSPTAKLRAYVRAGQLLVPTAPPLRRLEHEDRVRVAVDPAFLFQPVPLELG